MSTKVRPADCCTNPVVPMPLPAERQTALIGAFKALGDPSRFEIFRLIAAQTEPLCVCDIVDRFDLTQPTISHHLKVLRDAGLIDVSRRGVWAYYAANPSGLTDLRSAMSALMPVEAVLR
jgi:ArsR family transcriptional regulator